MATYTADDLASVKAAILALATGTRKVTVSFSTSAGTSSVTYGQADLANLRELQREIQADLNSTRPRQTRLYSRGGGFS